MSSRRCTILLTVAVLMLLVGCSSGNSPWSAEGGSDEIRFPKKHGASFNHCRRAGRGVATEIYLFVPEASRARSAANCRCWHSTLHIHFTRFRRPPSSLARGIRGNGGGVPLSLFGFPPLLPIAEDSGLD